MARLLTFLMILALVVTQGSAIAAAACRHQNVQEHVLARQSPDLKIAAVSLREDAAADAAAKKASSRGDSSANWPAELLPAGIATSEPARAERLRLRPREHSALASTLVAPLLEPPSA